jgi:hypothetical protein
VDFLYNRTGKLGKQAIPYHSYRSYRFFRGRGAIMTYKFTSPAEQLGRTWKTIALSLPPDSPLAVPKGQWERRNGHIVATYTREELKLAVGMALWQQRAELETRLRRGLERLATASDSAEADQLLAHWDALNAAYDRVVATIRDLGLEAIGDGDGD